MRAEPFTDYIVVDVMRVAVVAGALWLCALVLMLAWRRRQAPPRQVGAHPLTYLSYAAALFILGVRRVDTLGTPMDLYLFGGALVVGLGFVGVTRRVDFTTAPPWKRR